MTLIQPATARHSGRAPRPRLAALVRWLAAADARHRQRARSPGSTTTCCATSASTAAIWSGVRPGRAGPSAPNL